MHCSYLEVRDMPRDTRASCPADAPAKLSNAGEALPRPLKLAEPRPSIADIDIEQPYLEVRDMPRDTRASCPADAPAKLSNAGEALPRLGLQLGLFASSAAKSMTVSL
jgi:hypothetical protein